MTDDEDAPQLSAETLKALQEFLREQALQEDESNVTENWQLSQFWYDEDTTSVLSSAAVSSCGDDSRIALISCPTLYPDIKSKIGNSDKTVNVVLFEYDKRFSKYEPDFVFYDYNDPVNVDPEHKHNFDVIITDPPFLSEECLTKTSSTVEILKKPTSRIILCTGAVMEELATKLLNLKKCSFQPKHKNNLGNEFVCMTNFGEITK